MIDITDFDGPTGAIFKAAFSVVGAKGWYGYNILWFRRVIQNAHFIPKEL